MTELAGRSSSQKALKPIAHVLARVEGDEPVDEGISN
jgi:hypothetical protein